MSELSIVSQKYESTSELSSKVNAALTRVKKAYYALPGAEKLSQRELQAAMTELCSVAFNLSNVLSGRGEVPAAGKLPREFVEHVRRRHEGALPYFIDDLDKSCQRLRAGISSLKNKDLNLLEGINEAISEERALLFRRLWGREK